MTEAEWLTSSDPDAMLQFLEGIASERKFRLVACASCRRIWQFLVDERSRSAVETAERHADGLAADIDLELAAHGAWNVSLSGLGRSVAASEAAAEATWASSDKFGASYHSRLSIYHAFFASGEESNEHKAQIRYAYDIFGNPFRPVTLDSTWLTPAVVSLARTIYENRAFERMPELVSALEQAGCTQEEILAHCRGPGPHVRGCWVVDLLLGKE